MPRERIQEIRRRRKRREKRRQEKRKLAMLNRGRVGSHPKTERAQGKAKALHGREVPPTGSGRAPEELVKKSSVPAANEPAGTDVPLSEPKSSDRPPENNSGSRP